MSEKFTAVLPGIERTHQWCDRCGEEVPIDSQSGLCLWCDTPTRVKERRKVAKARPGDGRLSRITEERARLLNRIHIEQGVSMNRLAETLWGQLGYASQRSCLGAISAAFKRHGLPARDRIEATVAASRTHGLAPKHGPRPGYRTYLRRVIHGEPERRCEGCYTLGERAGERCEKPPMADSRFCFGHDPRLAEQREGQLKAMRAKQRDGDVLLDPAPFTRWLQGQHEKLGSWAKVGELIDRTATLAHAYGTGVATATKQPLEGIYRSTVDRLLEPAGLTVEDLYGEGS